MSSLEALIPAITLGLAAGMSPGPLTTLVVTATLERGFSAGLRVSLGPLATDLPLMAAALLMASQVPEPWLRGLGAAGGGVVLYLAVAAWRSAARVRLVTVPAPAGRASRDLRRGALVNLLNPNPWIFWFTIGAPVMARAWADRPFDAFLFPAVFLALLVGTKIGLAGLVARGRQHLNERAYGAVLRGCSLLLCVLGARLLWTNLRPGF